MKNNKIGEGYSLKWAKRIRAIRMLGGKCNKCGNTNILVLEFHHLYGKENILSKMMICRWSLLKREIKKCILLCGNCHSELHYRESRGTKLKDGLLKRLSIDPKCKRCGYVGGNLKSLCFHHRSNKDFDIGSALTRKINGCSVQDIIDEIKKCDILCRNCHTMEHINKNKFEKTEVEIYKKVDDHIELKRLNYDKIKAMKGRGLGISDISKKMGKGKSSIHYVFHRV